MYVCIESGYYNQAFITHNCHYRLSTMKTHLRLIMLFALLLSFPNIRAKSINNTPQPFDNDSTALDLKSNLTSDEIKVQKLKDNNKVVYFGNDSNRAAKDSVLYMITKFYIDQFRHFRDPLAPYFLLMSRDAKLAMGIGGSVRMRGWYDFDGSMPVNGFVPYMIPVPKDPARNRRIGGTPGGTALFFRVIGRNPILGDIMGYIQCDFSGVDNVTFRLKKAYAEIGDWTIGYASTTFSDPMADAPTIDGAGQNGRINRSSMLIRWMHTFRKNWGVAASIEMPQSNADVDNTNTKKIDDWIPDFAAFVQYQWGHNQHIRLSATLRTLPYRDLVSRTNRNIVGWGVQLSTVIWPLPNLALYGTVNTGHGYSSYMGDLSIGAYDLTTDSNRPGRMYAPMAVGLNLGARYNFTNSIYTCVALGRAQYKPRGDAAPDEYKYGLYGALNLFWEPTSRLQFGAEYLIGARHNVDGRHGSANRIDFLFQFAF